MREPLLIGICGHPGSGKSTLQEILETYGILPQDDGAILREHCMRIGNLTHEDVTTQDGKRRIVTIAGRNWQVRELLGKYGDALEALLGPDFIPDIAVRRALQHHANNNSALTVETPYPVGYSFGSVRRDQGRVYRRAGGLVVEVTRAGVSRSGNEFDEYDKSQIDMSIVNDFETVAELAAAVEKSRLGAFLREEVSR